MSTPIRLGTRRSALAQAMSREGLCGECHVPAAERGSLAGLGLAADQAPLVIECQARGARQQHGFAPDGPGDQRAVQPPSTMIVCPVT